MEVQSREYDSVVSAGSHSRLQAGAAEVMHWELELLPRL